MNKWEIIQMANKLRKFKQKCKTIVIRSKTDQFCIDFWLDWIVKSVSLWDVLKDWIHEDCYWPKEHLVWVENEIVVDLKCCINKWRAKINEIYWKEFLKFFWDWINPEKVDPDLLKDIFF